MIVYLYRDTTDSYDFVFFHGRSYPFRFKDLNDIRDRIHRAKIVDSFFIQSVEETNKDRMDETWKFKNLYSVRTNGQLISMSCNQLGLRLAELVCKELIDTEQGHTHFDEWSTQKSIELILRNKDTD